MITLDDSAKKEITGLAGKLIAFETTAEEPKELARCAAFIEKYFKDAGLYIERFEKNNCPSLLVTPLKGTKVRVLLNGHFDVVPGSDNLSKAKVIGGKLTGRGALDMKSQVAAMMVLMKQFAQENSGLPLGLLLVSDEETGGFNGSKYLVSEAKLKPEFVIAGEPTGLKIGNEAKGILQLSLTTRGKSAHSAKLWEGINAINSMVNGLASFLKDNPVPEPDSFTTTFNLAKVNGGDAINKVPDCCEATLDIRYIPSDPPELIIADLKNKYPGFEIGATETEPAAYCSPNNEFVRELEKTITEVTGQKAGFIKKGAASDVRHFNTAGIPGVVFGPHGEGSHSENEWVDLNSLFTFYEVLANFIDSTKTLDDRRGFS